MDIILPSKLYTTEAAKSKKQAEAELQIPDPDISSEVLEKILADNEITSKSEFNRK